MWASCSTTVSPVTCNGFRLKGCASSPHSNQKKVVIIGAGWAGLSSAHHLSKQGFDVTLIEAGNGPVPEVGIRGKLYSPSIKSPSTSAIYSTLGTFDYIYPILGSKVANKREET